MTDDPTPMMTPTGELSDPDATTITLEAYKRARAVEVETVTVHATTFGGERL